MFKCRHCTQWFETEKELDDHVLAARHWDDPGCEICGSTNGRHYMDECFK